MKFEWQELLKLGTDRISMRDFRAKVPGGWIVKEIYRNETDKIRTCTMVFIADYNHLWQIDRD